MCCDPLCYRTLLPAVSRNAAPYLESRKSAAIAAEQENGSYETLSGEKTVVAPVTKKQENGQRHDTAGENPADKKEQKEQKTAPI